MSQPFGSTLGSDPATPQVVSLPKRQTTAKQDKEPTKALNEQCRFFTQGRCIFGNKCRFKHASPQRVERTLVRVLYRPSSILLIKHTHQAHVTLGQSSQHTFPVIFSNSQVQPSTSSTPEHQRSHAHKATDSAPNPSIKRNHVKKSCLSWTKAGTCPKGNNCRFDHDAQVRSPIAQAVIVSLIKST